MLESRLRTAPKLHVVRKTLSSGSCSREITNVTAMRASVGFFSVNVIQPGNLAVKLVVRPEANGATLTGTGDVTLDAAAGAAELVRNVFDWLRDDLAAHG